MINIGIILKRPTKFEEVFINDESKHPNEKDRYYHEYSQRLREHDEKYNKNLNDHITVNYIDQEVIDLFETKLLEKANREHNEKLKLQDAAINNFLKSRV